MSKKYNDLLLLIAVSFTFLGCKKLLDEKPDAKLVVPTKIQELQALLDNNSVMNLSTAFGEGSSDNYFLTNDNWNSLARESDKNTYIWGDEIVFDDYPNDWSRLYSIVYNSNIALEYIDNLERNRQNEALWDNVKGSAYFFRARSFHVIATIWAKAYDLEKSSLIPGIPLRLTPDFNKVSVRSNLEETYKQIISDFKNACALLPNIPTHVMRPSKVAAYGFLARVYLSMGDYENALKYADSSLQINNILLDYNTLAPSENFPIKAFNSEVVFHSIVTLPQQLNNTRAMIDSNLYKSYDAHDIRKRAFFKSNNNGTYGFKGSYNGSVILFVGLATDEMYLTRAECYARKNKISEALNDLNFLLVNRWESGYFVPYMTATSESALQLILSERRKELLMRDLRWIDIKRLNIKEKNISLSRVINNSVYELPPNDNKFALPIPRYIIGLTSILNNER